MSSAEIEAEIKKVLQISEPAALQNSSKVFDTNAGSVLLKNHVAGVLAEFQEQVTNSTMRQTPDKSKLDIKTENQFHSVGRGRYSGCSATEIVRDAVGVDASSPKKRNRRKKKAVPGAADNFQECPLEMGPNFNEARLQQGISEASDFSATKQPTRKPATADSFETSRKEFPFRVSSAVESSKPASNPSAASASTSNWPNTVNVQQTNVTMSAMQAGTNRVKTGVVEPSGLVAQLGTSGIKFGGGGRDAAVPVLQPCAAGLGSHAVRETQTLGSVKKPADEAMEGGAGSAKVPALAESRKPATGVEAKTVASKVLDSPGPGRRTAEASTAPNSNESIEKELESNFIFPLKKKNARFPNAKYFCRMCEYHCDTVAHCQRHMKDTRHERLLSVLLEENLLKNMPSPSVQHCQAVTQAINQLVANVGMTESEHEARLVVFGKIQEITKRISGGATVTVYGSTVSLSALKDSDLNIDLTDACPAKLLKNLYLTLKDDRSGEFRDVKSDFQSKVPSVYVTVPSINLRIQIAVNNSFSVQTSKLLAVYNQLDARVRPLTIAFKYWAKICRIDRQIEGTLPSYVFGLMTVYFLQQCEPPVLPVLHELLTEDEKKLSDGTEYLTELKKVHARWQTASTSDVGLLWIEMLRFYCLELNTTDAVVCIREHKIVKRAEKKWTSKKLAIEDPFSRKRNVARSLSHSQVYEYIDERLRCAYKYFGIVPTGKLEFSFDDLILVPKKGPAIICSICQREGHLKSNCPDEMLPPLPRLPALNRRYINILNKVLHQVFEDFKPHDRELKQRMNLLGELQSIVQNTYPGTKLCLFGSSCNGFGFQYSDLDISLTFADHETAENLNCVEIIETLAKKLKRHHGYYNVFAITTAKVPIIKFKHTRSQLEGDISLYNTLAQHNTRMLQIYSEIDIRVRILGYTMKLLAKSCEICDASRGSLSSYAYTLMVIYYLQQRKPPVVPVLQELYRGKKPETNVDGWNAWFYEDLKNLPKVWNGYRKNQESISELWIGLLRFYTEEFNIKEYVISIRQREPLTKFEKLWNGSGIAIEDPFNLDHNLGSALSRKMNLYIIKVLRNARKIHGTPVDELNPRYMIMAEYLFDQMILTDSPPPNDRGCRRCGKIGHFVNECPLLRKGKSLGAPDPEEEEDEEGIPEKTAAKSIPVVKATKGASEPVKNSASDATKPAKQVGSSTPPDLSGSHSNRGPSDARVVGDATDRPATETHNPLLNGPLVFHNSKISSHDPTPMATSTGHDSAEVLLASQVQGSSSYLVPAMLPSGYPVFPPGGLTVSSAALAPWLAAASSAANQVPSLMSISVTNAGTSAIATGNMVSPRGFVQPLMTMPFYGYPLLPPAATVGSQMAMPQGNFSSMGGSTASASQLAKGQLSHQSQGQRKGQPLGSVAQQSSLLGQGQAQSHIPGLFQGQQVQSQAQVHQVPGQSVNKGQIQGQQLLGQVVGQLEGHQQQGHVKSQFQGQQQQGQAQVIAPNQSDSKTLPDEQKRILGSDMLKNSEPNQSSVATNQLSNFLPYGAISHPSVYPTSPFTMFMAQQFQQQQQQYQQQQYQQQQYQQMLQASLYQVLGLSSSGPTPEHGGGPSQPGRGAAPNSYAGLTHGSQMVGWPGNGSSSTAGVSGGPPSRLDSLSAKAAFGIQSNETACSQILPKEPSAQDSHGEWLHMQKEDGRN